MKLLILISIIGILFAGCIAPEIKPIKDTPQEQENQNVSAQPVQSDLIDDNNNFSGSGDEISGDEIRDAILEALDKSNKSDDTR